MSDKMSGKTRRKPFHGKPCIRCLLDPVDDAAAREIVKEYQQAVPIDERADETLYRERLSVCLDCKYLRKGVCLKSGFYVEARLYRKSGRCPVGLF